MMLCIYLLMCEFVILYEVIVFPFHPFFFFFLEVHCSFSPLLILLCFHAYFNFQKVSKNELNTMIDFFSLILFSSLAY